MKRPSGLWILLSAGVLWLSIQNVYGVRGTSLIFGKSTTTTTTTPSTEEEEAGTTDVNVDSNTTKPTLTGNPQIDYIWDPNLPKELNGYNLSDYPFYERVPKDIDFKCDGLHDGFYASIKHKCQVYHNCLFGVRYDFLCANFTAFDQTLFNCNFVSNVDCENSKKHWYRNDDLYKAASTTAAPTPYNFYTQVPPLYPLTPSPSQRSPQGNFFSRRLPPVQQVSGDQLISSPGQVQSPQGSLLQRLPPIQQVPAAQLVPLTAQVDLPIDQRPQLRPQESLRPRLDYYDIDDYEERPRVMYRRKRPRPRPVYYDDYDYYDDRPYRRSESRRRRPYNRRFMAPAKRNQDKIAKYEYEDDETDYVDDVMEGKRKYVRLEERPISTRRKQPSRQKRPIEDDTEEDYEEEYMVKEKRRRQPSQSAGYKDGSQATSNKKGMESDNARNHPEDSRVVIKPKTGTLYDRPRVAPRINLPVPKNVAKKYAYKSEESDIFNEDISVSTISENVTTTTQPPPESTRKRPLNPRRNNRNRTNSNIAENARTAISENDEIQGTRADMNQQRPSTSEEPTEECSRNCRGGSRSRTRNNSTQKKRLKVFRTLVSNRDYSDSESRDDEKIIDIDKLYGTYDASLNEA